MAIYVLQISDANHWGRPTKVTFYGPFLNQTQDMASPPTIMVGSRDNKVAEANARRWMNHPWHAERGVLRSAIVEMDEPVADAKEPFSIW